ncbi:hypothetical protein SDC9_80672 [bioreactor metagenome]|uniref:Beta-lactamase class A catalytic domain-containing protein n=1 Tax=bioreactor metagenome TaxID=1076179 RepID=A0A644Z241_9ZZZZ|nr:serine hydrolase [Oscillospiraceae bacterium]
MKSGDGNNGKTAITILSVLLFACAAALCFSLVLNFSNKKAGEETDKEFDAINEKNILLSAQIAEAEEKSKALRTSIAEKADEIEELKAQAGENASKYSGTIKEYENKITSLENEKYRLESELTVSDQKILTVRGELNSINSQVNKLKEKVSDDSVKLKLYEDILSIQNGAANKLVSLLSNPPKNDNGDIAQVSLYYENLVTGETMEYNADSEMFSASLIKAPYILNMLQTTERYAVCSVDAESGVKTFLPESGIYDLSDIYVYNKVSDYLGGSGVIRNAEDGARYTYYELAELSIAESDNIAFAALRNRFGYDEFYNYSASLNVTLAKKGAFWYSTARNMGRYFKDIYRYVNSGAEYADFYSGCLLRASLRTIICQAVAPTPALHKYGRDSANPVFHDAAVVLDEKAPYVLVIMTELGGITFNDQDYVRQIASAVNEIHISLNPRG